MPQPPVPDRFRDLLDGKFLGHFATVDSHGRPQVNPVWYIWDGERLCLSIRPETAKYSNLRSNPAVAMSILDPTSPGRYLELRGEVESFELFTTLAWVNQLAHKYSSADFTGGTDGQERYKVTIRIDRWTGQG